MDKIILDHYNKLARDHGASGMMSMQDTVIRERETKFIIEQTRQCLRALGLAPEQARIMDVGCGNGFLLESMWHELCPGQMTGLEFVPALVEIAQKRNLPGVTIQQADMRLPQTHSADVVITERSVVNLLSWDEQKAALENISSWVRPGGFYIMVESFHESWSLMNSARREIGLEEVPVSPHNRYLREAVTETLAKLGLRKVSGVESEHALSSYFFLSRVLQHTLKNGQQGETLKFLTQGLKDDVGTYSPIQFRVFQKDSR